MSGKSASQQEINEFATATKLLDKLNACQQSLEETLYANIRLKTENIRLYAENERLNHQINCLPCCAIQLLSIIISRR